MSSGVPSKDRSNDQSSSNTTTNIKELFVHQFVHQRTGCMKRTNSDVESKMSLKEMEEAFKRKRSTKLENIEDTR